MKNKEEKKNRIWVPIVIGALACSAAVGTGIALVHNQQRPKAGTVATMSDAADFSGLTTEVAEVTTEAVIEAAVSGSEKPEAVPATTEIGGGKKKAEETTEEKKPNATESTKPSTNHSNNSGSGNSGQSTTSKPSNSGSSSGNSGSGNSGNSGSGNSGSGNSTPSPKPSTPATTEAPKPSTTEAPKPSTTEAPTTQHQHVYDQVVVDTPEQSVHHPAEYKTVPAVECHGCGGIFTSADAYFAHSCGDAYGFTDTTAKIKVQDEYTEVIPAKTHRECKCGARE